MKRWQVGDVMTRGVVSVPPTAGYQEIADLLVHRSISAVPVVDGSRHVLGVVSEADLLAKLEYADRVPRHALAARRMRGGRRRAAGDTAAELMTAPAVAIAATATVTRAARLMDAARVKRMPVIDERGRLVRMYTRPDADIGAAVTDGVLRPLWIDRRHVRVAVRAGIVTLTGRVDRRSVADILVAFSRATPGVVDVVDELECDVDDTCRELSPR